METLKQRAIAIAGAILLSGLGMGAAVAADFPVAPNYEYQGAVQGPPMYYAPPVVYYRYAPQVVVVPRPFYPRPYYGRYYAPPVYGPYARRFYPY